MGRERVSENSGGRERDKEKGDCIREKYRKRCPKMKMEQMREGGERDGWREFI